MPRLGAFWISEKAAESSVYAAANCTFHLTFATIAGSYEEDTKEVYFHTPGIGANPGYSELWNAPTNECAHIPAFRRVSLTCRYRPESSCPHI